MFSKTLAAALALCAASPAATDAAAQLPAIDTAKSLIEAGALRDAQDLLAAQDQGDPEVLFLEAQIDGRRGQWREAERLYRRILADHPALARARLELGRALAEQGNDVAAEFQFRLALAGDLPPPVARNVSAFLDSIRQRRRWSADLSAGALADSNMNRSTSQSTVDIFGLSFILSQEARQKSGFGFTFSAAGEYAAPAAEGLKVRSGVTFFRNDYQGGQFDDMQVQGYAGPQVTTGRSDASLLALVLKRWYGNAPYYEGYGVRAEAGSNTTDRLRLDTFVQVARLWYPRREFLDGYQVDMAVTPSYALSPASFARGLLGFGHQDTQDAAWRNNYGRASLGYGRDLGWGISSYAEFGAAYFVYDGRIFDQNRRDWLLSAAVTFTAFGWNVAGFWPQTTVGYQRNLSTVDLFTFDRAFVQIGVTRHF